uniref:Uncharacterized protein n=1 Tax=Sphaerodactylus townsendi TaxID=933632 RepID=A0ACB8GB32_9SAUR
MSLSLHTQPLCESLVSFNMQRLPFNGPLNDEYEEIADSQRGSDLDPDNWEEQRAALARAKQDWELERETLEREREALELEREQFRRERNAEIAQEKELLREQFLKDLERSRMVLDHTKQDLERQRECVKALKTQGEVEAALQRQERERLRQERETLAR